MLHTKVSSNIIGKGKRRLFSDDAWKGHKIVKDKKG